MTTIFFEEFKQRIRMTNQVSLIGSLFVFDIGLHHFQQLRRRFEAVLLGMHPRFLEHLFHILAPDYVVAIGTGIDLVTVNNLAHFYSLPLI